MLVVAGFDLVVVGGGVVGSSAALAGVRRGATVALVDAGLVGRASHAGAGIVSPVVSDDRPVAPEWTAVITRCVEYYRDLIADVDGLDPTNAGSATFRMVGELIVARGDVPREQTKLAIIKERLSTEENRVAQGVSVAPEVLDGPEVRRLWPELCEDVEAIFIKDAGRVSGDRLTERLLRAAHQVGSGRAGPSRLTIVPGWASLDLSGSTPCVRVGNERLSAGAVVLASGAWASSELDAFGLAVQIRPLRGQIVHLRLGDESTGGRPVVQTGGSGYLLGFDDRIVVGATTEDVGFDARVTGAGQRQVLDRALGLAPGLGAATLLETRVGLRPMSSDSLPLIGAVAPGIHLALGLGARGLALGPYFGQLIAADALGDGLPDWAAFLSPTRTPTPDTSPEN